jgi:hypothetical protein
LSAVLTVSRLSETRVAAGATRASVATRVRTAAARPRRCRRRRRSVRRGGCPRART